MWVAKYESTSNFSSPFVSLKMAIFLFTRRWNIFLEKVEEKDWVHFSNCDPVFWVDFGPSYCKRCGNYWASSGALKWNVFNSYLQFLCLSIEFKKLRA